ncbi:hypothetical protein [Thermoplasma acidophilum]|uniref:HTH marR-type domain-containing protein n=2 Tax=Thermoplasma acidophilum TaxID=2303 RepID=Q9HKC3_THEAC|nr:hypothetical protein [Thermoplasma acidophilum]
MIGSYALSILDEAEVLVDLLTGGAPKVNKIFLITSSRRKRPDYYGELESCLKEMDLNLEIITVDDVSNFFEVYLILEKICELEGTPKWVNVGSGHGIMLSALAVHAFIKDALLVAFDKEEKKVIVTDIKKLKRIKIYQKRYFELISELGEGEKTITELSKIFNLSRSAMSRRLKHMETLNIVVRKGTGRSNIPYVFKLTELGRKLL